MGDELPRGVVDAWCSGIDWARWWYPLAYMMGLDGRQVIGGNALYILLNRLKRIDTCTD